MKNIHKHNSTIASLVGAAATIVAFLPSAAQADSRTDRDGVTLGGALMFGHLGCKTSDGGDCNGDGVAEAGGLNLRAGVMVSPRLAIALDLAAMTHREDRIKTTQAMAAVTARGWVAPQIWLEGGLGMARASAEYDLTIANVKSETDTVPGFLVGVGVEVVSAPKFAIDVGLRAATSFYKDDIQLYNVALTVGASFF